MAIFRLWPLHLFTLFLSKLIALLAEKICLNTQDDCHTSYKTLSLYLHNIHTTTTSKQFHFQNTYSNCKKFQCDLESESLGSSPYIFFSKSILPG